MNIDNMPAGREMDALIAEKVMGWRYKEGPKFDYSGPCEWNMILLPPTISDDEYIHWNFPPKGVISKTFFLDKHYSADIAAAWEVAEKMNELGYRHTINRLHDYRYSTPTDHVCFGKIKPEYETEYLKEHLDVPFPQSLFNLWHGYGNTAPLAICRAALKALGVTEV